MTGEALAKRTRWSIGMALAVAAVIGFWFVWRRAEHQSYARDERAGSPAAAADAPVAFVPRAPLLPLPSLPSLPALPPAKSETAEPSPDLQVVGPHADDPHQPGMHPHPMDETRERLNAENHLLQRLNDAMSFRRVAEMRALIVAYRNLDPSDADLNQAGYTVVADCIETPGEASLAAAHHFYDTQRHSPLRRYVRRICFENSQ